MNTKYKHLVISVFLTVFSINTICAQEQNLQDSKELYSKLSFYDYRGTNAIDAAIGTSVINGDFTDAEFELYFKLGYKRHITDHLNINFTYNKYNVAFRDLYNEGFMSFDLNIEYLFNPYEEFTPFIQAGYGYNAANYFETTAAKAQGAIGIEYIVTDGLGLKLFGEYNHAFSDELDGLIAGESDDTFFRLGLGINLYFGGNKRKQELLSYIDTVIQSNLVK
ncbi:outer membrane beta-barrel protein [Winogradskyella sp.]|uniref:outer membrane beta-barrel protein n=1 Tax=Winogradskyella sp. TaxID=1883156 RepID=UPI0025D0BC1F|nr:outer membrane beta-barrel protein [Winogradskyella sp.]